MPLAPRQLKGAETVTRPTRRAPLQSNQSRCETRQKLMDCRSSSSARHRFHWIARDRAWSRFSFRRSSPARSCGCFACAASVRRCDLADEHLNSGIGNSTDARSQPASNAPGSTLERACTRTCVRAFCGLGQQISRNWSAREGGAGAGRCSARARAS